MAFITERKEAAIKHDNKTGILILLFVFGLLVSISACTTVKQLDSGLSDLDTNQEIDDSIAALVNKPTITPVTEIDLSNYIQLETSGFEEFGYISAFSYNREEFYRDFEKIIAFANDDIKKTFISERKPQTSMVVLSKEYGENAFVIKDSSQTMAPIDFLWNEICNSYYIHSNGNIRFDDFGPGLTNGDELYLENQIAKPEMIEQVFNLVLLTPAITIKVSNLDVIPQNQCALASDKYTAKNLTGVDRLLIEYIRINFPEIEARISKHQYMYEFTELPGGPNESGSNGYDWRLYLWNESHTQCKGDCFHWGGTSAAADCEFTCTIDRNDFCVEGKDLDGNIFYKDRTRGTKHLDN